MTAPPDIEVAAPLANETATYTLTSDCHSSDFVAGTKRRRAAARRLPVLDHGRSDPWQYDELPLTEQQIEAWRRTVAHLHRAGFCAIVPAEVRAVLR